MKYILYMNGFYPIKHTAVVCGTLIAKDCCIINQAIINIGMVPTNQLGRKKTLKYFKS